MPTPPDPYASHLSTLHAVTRRIMPRRVLEFGAGWYSTPFFLSMPGLEELISVERDPKWARKIVRKCRDDRLKLVSPPHDFVAAPFDLIFIDDGKNAAERAETIRWVLGQPHPPVVIHDAEVPEYAAVIKELGAGPATAVLW